MEAVTSELESVRRAREARIESGRGGYPAAVAIAWHSSSIVAARSAPPAVTLSPTADRVRHVIAANDARNTHFSHISSRIASLAMASNFTPAIAAAITS